MPELSPYVFISLIVFLSSCFNAWRPTLLEDLAMAIDAFSEAASPTAPGVRGQQQAQCKVYTSEEGKNYTLPTFLR